MAKQHYAIDIGWPGGWWLFRSLHAESTTITTRGDHRRWAQFSRSFALWLSAVNPFDLKARWGGRLCFFSNKIIKIFSTH